jgi:hypothetical protein
MNARRQWTSAVPTEPLTLWVRRPTRLTGHHGSTFLPPPDRRTAPRTGTATRSLAVDPKPRPHHDASRHLSTTPRLNALILTVTRLWSTGSANCLTVSVVQLPLIASARLAANLLGRGWPDRDEPCLQQHLLGGNVRVSCGRSDGAHTMLFRCELA